jgi:predicted amidohydrolase YtcJ
MAYLAANPEVTWVDCGSFENDVAAGGALTAKLLDLASAAIPIVVHAADHHSIWVNTAALRVAGFLDVIPPLTSGSVDVDAEGRPTGIVREWQAMSLIYAHQPPPTLESDIEAICKAQERLLAAGIVAVQEAWIDRGMPEGYLALAKSGSLKMRVNLMPRIDVDSWREDLAFAKATRSEVRAANNELLTVNTVKVFIDGVFDSGTALLGQPYCDGHQAAALWPDETLAEMALAADSAGFQLHFHAIGDLAVEKALYAVEHVFMCNGPVDRRPVIAHAELISNESFKRMRDYGVVVCQQAVWATNGPALDGARAAIGASAETLYPIRRILDERIRLSFGSDWPVSDPEPMPGIITATTRRNPGSTQDPHNPGQAISRSEALAAYSLGTAYQAGQELVAHQDEVVFDRDLLHCSDDELLEARVLSVSVAGREVYRVSTSVL